MNQQTERFTIANGRRIPSLRSRVFAALLFLVFGNAATEALAQSAGTFASTGSMITPRYGNTATLLPNGQVLIAGGQVLIGGTIARGVVVLSSAGLYDPSTRTFLQTGDMTTPRTFHSATLLPNGKVLVGGGGYPGSVNGYQVNFRVPTDAQKGTASVQVIAAWISSPLATFPVQ